MSGGCILSISPCQPLHAIGYCGSPLLKEANHYTFRTIPREHWSKRMSMARPS